jgi:hypothetical protein
MRELYFLCSRVSGGERPEWADALVTVKASPTEHMYIAAASRSLAEQLLALFPVRNVIVAAAHELLAKHHHDFKSIRVAVIESERDLAQFAADRNSFPFERCAIRYA